MKMIILTITMIMVILTVVVVMIVMMRILLMPHLSIHSIPSSSTFCGSQSRVTYCHHSGIGTHLRSHRPAPISLARVPKMNRSSYGVF